MNLQWWHPYGNVRQSYSWVCHKWLKFALHHWANSELPDAENKSGMHVYRRIRYSPMRIVQVHLSSPHTTISHLHLLYTHFLWSPPPPILLHCQIKTRTFSNWVIYCFHSPWNPDMCVIWQRLNSEIIFMFPSCSLSDGRMIVWTVYLMVSPSYSKALRVVYIDSPPILFLHSYKAA